ncbi:MAG: hypothetical protein QOJ73_6315 [Streptosporangiaceae bacterium]|jgi:hypothetical protein|nr:hypothetical protein [Streptosporangiaceae bacterium]
MATELIGSLEYLRDVPKSREQPHRKHRSLRGLVLLLVVIAAVIVYIGYRRITPVLEGTGCRAVAGRETYTLDPEQARIAATIAGVAHKQSMPEDAVTIAYAAALQESKLHNLSYGDMDSVGVFQQRPSEGWGSTRQLEDPVYATTQFFRALTGVHNYLKLPVYQAAQAVQRSADGTAYMQYQQMAAKLAGTFTGRDAHGVSCWSASTTPKRTNLAGADVELARTFGGVSVRQNGPANTGHRAQLLVPPAPDGWEVAAWLVTHATSYGIREVRFGGYQWQASTGFHGWSKDAGAPPPGVIQLS